VPCRARQATAIASASATRSAVWLAAVAQPAISRENASMTNAVQAMPAQVGAKVKSTARSRSGAGGAKSRFTRSGGRSCEESRFVVRTFQPPRRTPRSPSVRISRSAVQRAAGMPSRLSWSHTFQAPYRSPLSLCTRAISFSSAASRTARADGARARAA
jgi:hypothetical protein